MATVESIELACVGPGLIVPRVYASKYSHFLSTYAGARPDLRITQVARAHHGYCYTPCVRAIDLRLTVGVRECGLCRKLFNERLVSVRYTYCAALMSRESLIEASLGRADAPHANHPHAVGTPFIGYAHTEITVHRPPRPVQMNLYNLKL